MQMGARWMAGEAAHRSVPAVLLPAIAHCEQETPGAGSWTLTWLEGLPRLALDGQLRLTADADGVAHFIAPEGPHYSAQSDGLSDEDDDDDWLN